MRQWTTAVLMKELKHPIGRSPVHTLCMKMLTCGWDWDYLLNQTSSSQMVSSLLNWLHDNFGQGEAVELLLSGLLLLHLLVIIFFVFSRGNASAFLQWFTSISKSTLFWSTVKMVPSSYKWDLWLFVMFRIIKSYYFFWSSGLFDGAFPALPGWAKARERVTDGCKDILRWSSAWYV